MADLIQALQSTSVPTLLVFIGIITIFLALGARLTPVEIPRDRRMIFGIMGSIFLLIGIFLFAWTPNDEGKQIESTITPTPINSPEPTIERVILPTRNITITPSIEPTVTATATLSATSTLFPTPTNTAIPTPLPTSTNTAIPTPTEMEVDGLSKIVIQTIAADVEVFYGPSSENSRAGLLKLGDKVEAIGTVRGGIWIEVVLENGNTGWVDANQVLFINGTIHDLPQTWPRTITGEGTSSSGGSCTLKAFTVQDEFGTVWVRWQDLPNDTHRLILTITALLNGEFVELLESQDIDASDEDTATIGFELGTWRFNPTDPSWKGFPPNSTYHFVLIAQDAGNNVLCIVQGDFVR